MEKNKLFYSDQFVKLYTGDSRNMEELKKESIGFIVTSPPYWDLKNYNHNTQIGLGQDYKEYLEELKKVFIECGRVLKPGCFFALVIGTRISDGELKHIPMDCIGIFNELGFILKKELIWCKPKGTQGLWQRGTTQYLKKKPYPKCANFNIQHEFILVFQKDGENQIEEREKLPENFIKEVAWTVWELKVSNSKGHPAPFPVELPKRLIQIFSFSTDIILDPFWGIGSTSIAASQLKRKSIGYEISEDFCKKGIEYLKREGRLLL